MIMFKYQFNKKSKAQTSMEFLAIFIFLLLILVAMSYVSFYKSIDILESRKYFESNNLLKKTADKINIVFIEGSGFSMNTTLPLSVYGQNYTFDIVGNVLKLNVFNRTYDKLLVTENIIGVPHQGLNVLENIENVIVIT